MVSTPTRCINFNFQIFTSEKITTVKTLPCRLGNQQVHLQTSKFGAKCILTTKKTQNDLFPYLTRIDKLTPSQQDVVDTVLNILGHFSLNIQNLIKNVSFPQISPLQF